MKFWIEKIDSRSDEVFEEYYAISDIEKINYMLSQYDKRHLIRKTDSIFYGLDEEGNCESIFRVRCI